MTELAKYTPAQIAQIQDVSDAVKVKKIADAAAIFYRAQDDLTAAQYAKEMSLRSAHRAGELLLGTPREQGKRTDIGTSVTRYAKLLDDTGISPSTARNWQKLASITEEQLELYFAEAEYKNWEYTQYSLLRFADGKDSKQLDHRDWLRIARGYCHRLQGSAASEGIQLAALRFLRDT